MPVLLPGDNLRAYIPGDRRRALARVPRVVNSFTVG